MVRILAAPRDTESSAACNGDAIVVGVVIDEYYFEIRIAAEQGAADALPDRGRFVAPGDHDRNERFFGSPRPYRQRRAYRSWLHEIDEPADDRRKLYDDERKDEGSPDDIDSEKALENPRFDIGSSEDIK